MIRDLISRAHRSTINAIVYSNLWVAISAGSLTLGVALINQLTPVVSSVLLNICLTFLSYNYIYWVGNRFNPSKMDCERKKWMNNHEWFSLFLNAIAASYSIYQLSNSTFRQWTLLFLLIAFSSLYILPSKTDNGIRWLPGIKIYIISLSWAILIVPFSFENALSFGSQILQTLIVFTLVAALAIPFDLRDLRNDTEELKTIPQIIGAKGGVQLSQFLFLIVGTILLLKTPDSSIKTVHFILLISSLLLIQNSINQKPMYYIFWIEGIPFFWVCGILLVK